MSDPILSLRDVSLTLNGNAGPVSILRGIDLDVARGETLGLVGPSGSGKSSLLMLMGGLDSATSGTVLALGQDLTRMDEDRMARFRRDHMGVVFQSFHLIPTMTALENVATPLELAGVADAFDRAAAELAAVGLGARIDHYPAQLSGGEQQRVAIVRALLKQPDWLFLDEATAALDEPMEAQVYALLRERLPGTTLVSIGHRGTLLALHDRRVERPAGSRAMTLPQRPYIPLGSLRGAMTYPDPPRATSEADLVSAMQAVGLDHLIPRLDDDAIWTQALSGGEQQRVAIVRALLKRPDWLFLDEATAALDEPMEAQVYALLRERLPDTTLVSIGHRTTLLGFHDRRVEMRPGADGAFTPAEA